MRTADTAPPIDPDSTALQERRWREMYDLAARGLIQPESLSVSEVAMISGVALLGIREARLGVNGPPAGESKR